MPDHSLDQKMQAIRNLTDMFRFEWLVYLGIIVLCLAIFITTVAMALFSGDESISNSAIAEQEALVEHRLNTVDGLEQEADRLTYAPELRPNAHAEEIPDIRDYRGRQMYDFMLWIDRAAFRDREIAEVTRVSDARYISCVCM